MKTRPADLLAGASKKCFSICQEEKQQDFQVRAITSITSITIAIAIAIAIAIIVVIIMIIILERASWTVQGRRQNGF